MRIFLSYGHDDYASLALHIKRDLEALGHEVWFDVERLRPGGDWERYIEEGFEFASKDNESGRFLLLMTPHSVRRRDGYCLNELARAYGRNLPIIPVMVSSVEPPLSIGRLQWIDMRQCFPVEQHEKQYAKQFEQLVKALTEKQVPFEGVQQRLLNYLQPITYADDLTRHLSRFTGREWVMNEVEEWLSSSRRVLWITGEAGVGKSALAAWLCNKRPEIAAYHFCRFGNSDRVNARKALLSLAYQLSTQIPVYQDRLNASPLDKTLVETNLPAVFDCLFVNPLTDAVPLTKKPQVLLIDALDEATRSGRNELARLIGGEFDRLPSWLRLIVTSRPHEQEINSQLQALDPWKLDAGRAENLQDIRTYLYRELRPFTGNGAPSEEVVSEIVDKSAGLFLYVSLVREELEKGRLSLSRVQEFPQGLGEVYLQWFQRYFPDLKLYESDWRPALEVICAAREPMPRDYLTAMMGWSEYKMDSLAAQLGSLFPFIDDRVRPVHQSVRDWLTDRKSSGVYRASINVGEQRLGDFALQQYQRGVGSMSVYSIVHAPSHLAACQRRGELKELLLDPDWIKANLQAAGIVLLLTDYDLALDAHSTKRPLEAERSVTDEPETSALRIVQGALRLSANVMARDPDQFSSQMVGRLLPCQDVPGVDEFVKRVVEGTRIPWLRSLQATLHPPGTALIRTLQGHAWGVNGVALSGDGRLAVSASNDNTLMVWEVESGRELRALQGHTGYVASVTLSRDGRLAVSASGGFPFSDDTLKVWDVQTGRELRTLKGHSDGVNGVALSGDERLAVSASADGTLKVWEVKSGRELRTLQGHSASVNDVALSADGRLAVSASEDKTLKVWEVESGRELRTLKGHAREVNRVALSGDERLAVSASADGTLKVWEVKSGRELRTFKGHSDEVNSVALSGDERLAVSASADGTLKVWEVKSGRELRTLQGHSASVNDVALSADGRLAVSASYDKTLKVWEVEGGRDLRTLKVHTGVVTDVALSTDGRLAVSASDYPDRTLKVWDVENGRELRTLAGSDCVALSGDGRVAVSESSGGTLKVWDVENGRELRTLQGHTNALVAALALSGDARLVVSASYDNTLKVWEVESGRELRTLVGHTDPVNGVALSSDGRLAVSVAGNLGTGELKVWDVEIGRELRTIAGHTSIVNDVALSGDGRLAVSASDDKTLKVWEVESGRELRTLQGHTDRVSGVALSGGGRLAVSASLDNTLKVWDLETGAVRATFICDGEAYCCTICDALKLIVAGDLGGRIYFLRLEEPKPKM